MNDELAQTAISAAFKGKWKEAVAVNKKILTNNPCDLDALNRLARAYAECGNNRRAIATSKKVLLLDPVNSIASKCLTKWKSLKTTTKESSIAGHVDDFLEEPGKTKIVKLLHLGDEKIFNCLTSGDEVKLVCHAHRVSVHSLNNKYIGRFADDVSMRLRNLIKQGYVYKVLIKSVNGDDLKVFLREIDRGQGMESFPSFPAEKLAYIAYIPPHLPRHETGTLQFSEELQE